ncbi:polyprenyl synthetase family protein [Aestuariimicrobium sp. T2.26MG-19.2B]|uniref:polyprenyl synthetase family protein n=1 Tax=Aestuariimicrobium sp. T2.26MG-19.2B TaxID=3040679 RepID=UPI00247764E9|nr:polyprenyl synthetase family protein [Aestuariimicrobium sp. T2.26MG-19.2B]CAI9406075.1 Octaprenyl diphosphate synthase [Aestuariimicrobium sp. T2.26MG-19.2B]
MSEPSREESAEAFRGQINEWLEVVEERLAELAIAGNPYVTEASQHIIAAGGKRFRPQLVILASQFGGPVEDEALVKAACVVELTHVASLYHDDVMDAADKRRGAASANALYGNSIAILVGDYLFARASSTVATLGTDYVLLQAATFARLVHGQIAETRGPQPGDDPVQHHLQVVADKTGSLIAAAARFGGMVSGAEPATLDLLEQFGEEIGVIFQLSDDLIDITSEVTGKTPGTDLREGVPTLTTLLLRQGNDPADAELLALIDGDLDTDEALTDALDRLRAHPVLDEAKAEVRRRAEVARALVRQLPAGIARDALDQLCDSVVERVS